MDRNRADKIKAFVGEWVSAHPLAIYAGHGDFDDVAGFVSGCRSRGDLEGKLWQAYADQALGMLLDAARDAIASFCQAEGIPSPEQLPEAERTLIFDGVMLGAPVEYPVDQWLSQKVRADLIFKGSNEDISSLGYDKGALLGLMSLMGVMDPMRTLDEAIVGRVDPSSPDAGFLASAGAECRRAAESGGSCVLCALAELSVRDLLRLRSDPSDCVVELTPQHYLGFYDPRAGGGCQFEIEAPIKLNLPGDWLEAVLIEQRDARSDEGYITADSVCGFTSRAFVPTRVAAAR